MHFLLSIIFIITAIKLGEKIGSRFQSHRYFVSIPYIASILVLTLTFSIDFLFEYVIQFHTLSGRLFVTLFLFTIGFQIANIYRKMHWKRVGILLILCTFLIIALEAFSLLFPVHISLLVGPILLGFNEELLAILAPFHLHDFLLFWGSIQMAIVFLCTPLFLFSVEKITRQHEAKISESEELPLHLSFSLVIVLAVCLVIVLLKDVWLEETVLFIFDFVLSMILGFLFGKWTIRKDRQRHELTKRLHTIGTFSLYGFIIFSIQAIYHIEWSYFHYEPFFIILTKTIVIAFFAYWVTSNLLEKLPFADSLVAIVAGWTFTLNAPVVCMHGMRTVVNKFGPAPGVLLIVPPVILWLVNYLKVLLHHIL